MMPTTRRAMQMPVMVSTRFWYSSSASRKGQKQRRLQHGEWLGKEHIVNRWHATNHCTDSHSHIETAITLHIDTLLACKENRDTP